MSLQSNNICTVILAGGMGRRMQGEDKGLIEWQGKPLIEHVLSSLDTDNDCIIINANRNQARYEQYGHPVVHDTIDGYQGPLIGILSAMKYTDRDYLLCLPCDSPEPPVHLQQRLMKCVQDSHAQSAICHDGSRTQPLFCLIACNLQNKLEAFIAEGNRKVHDFFHSTNPAICDFSDQPQQFHNFNRPEDMQ